MRSLENAEFQSMIKVEVATRCRPTELVNESIVSHDYIL